jgi:putative hydrolase of the HAD superfamily
MNPTAFHAFKAIIFDLGKVIVDFDHFDTCRKLAEYSPYSPEQIYNKIFISGIEDKFDTGQISPYLFFKTVQKDLQLTTDMDSFREIWVNIFTLNPGIEQLVYRLKNSYKLICLSNTNQWHFEFCVKNFQVLSNFDSFILSYKTGKKKPHRNIFTKAVSEANALPHECLYIDDIRDFVEAAETTGIKGVHFISVEQLEMKLKEMGVLLNA